MNSRKLIQLQCETFDTKSSKILQIKTFVIQCHEDTYIDEYALVYRASCTCARLTGYLLLFCENPYQSMDEHHHATHDGGDLLVVTFSFGKGEYS